MKYLIYSLAIFIFGCSHLCEENRKQVDSSTREVISPVGGKAYVVKCEMSEDCYTISGRMCPAGYARIDGWYGNKNIVHFTNNATALIQCKQPNQPEVIIPIKVVPPENNKEEAAIEALFNFVGEKQYTCNRALWSGQYLVTSELKRGNCVSEIPDAIIEFSAGEAKNKASSPGCVSEERWVEAECRLVRETYCNRADGYEIHKAMFIQNSPDGSTLSGGKIVRRMNANQDCSGHFKLTAIRQN